MPAGSRATNDGARPKPLRLRADNFTPAARTPWGGRRILGAYKADLGLSWAEAIVGESWEISVEPSFPSRVEGVRERTLASEILADPLGWLGESVARRHSGQTPLLVKLVDAAESLSVQVHPAEGDPELAPGESGKPEAWVVLDAEPGAGLYLGFREGVTREDVERALKEGAAIDSMMSFVPVIPGEAFVIEAGTPHAIGAGVTLIEPQFVSPGRRGVTYRFWDWNRRYDAAGQPDPAGAPRELHVERSLAVTAWSAPRGEAFVATCRAERRVVSAGPVTREVVVDWPWFSFERWSGSGSLSVEPAGTMVGITCVGGSLRVASEAGELALRAGESGAIPAAAGALSVEARDAVAFAVRSSS